jgi:hypothetical protein
MGAFRLFLLRLCALSVSADEGVVPTGEDAVPLADPDAFEDELSYDEGAPGPRSSCRGRPVLVLELTHRSACCSRSSRKGTSCSRLYAP